MSMLVRSFSFLVRGDTLRRCAGVERRSEERECGERERIEAGKKNRIEIGFRPSSPFDDDDDDDLNRSSFSSSSHPSFSFQTKPNKPTSTAIVLQYPHAVEAAAREWGDRYQARRQAATAELMNLVVAAVGGEVAVSAADVEEGDIDSLVQDLVTSGTAHGLVDTFGKGKQGRDARAAYARLWSLVVGEVASRGLLGDNYVIEKTVKLLLGLTW